MPYLVIKKIASKSPYILSIDALRSTSLRKIWGFLSVPRVLLYCLNERLEYNAAFMTS